MAAITAFEVTLSNGTIVNVFANSISEAGINARKQVNTSLSVASAKPINVCSIGSGIVTPVRTINSY